MGSAETKRILRKEGYVNGYPSPKGWYDKDRPPAAVICRMLGGPRAADTRVLEIAAMYDLSEMFGAPRYDEVNDARLVGTSRFPVKELPDDNEDKLEPEEPYATY